MSVYLYRAVDGQGELVEGTGTGASREEVAAELQERGWIPLEIAPAGERGHSDKSESARRSFTWLRSWSSGGVGTATELTRQLAVLVQAGLPLDRSLEILLELERGGPLEQPISDIWDALRNGRPFSEALADHPPLFTPLYISLVRAGEASGALGQVLGELAEHLERLQDLRSRVRSALIYPALLLSVAVSSILILLIWVIPRFEEMFSGLGATMPLPTQIVIATGNFLADYWFLLLLVVLSFALLARALLRFPAVREHWDAALLGLPFVGMLVARIQLARFSRTLGTLLRNGIPLVEAIALSAGTVSNVVYQRAIHGIDARLRQGETLTSALSNTGERIPALAIHMVRVGEETGRLDEMLLRMAEIYERESDVSVQRYVAVLEPALILLLGVLIGGIVISVLVAILSINATQF